DAKNRCADVTKRPITVETLRLTPYELHWRYELRRRDWQEVRLHAMRDGGGSLRLRKVLLPLPEPVRRSALPGWTVLLPALSRGLRLQDSGRIGFGLWALGFGLWALGFGLWALGFWALGFWAFGLWAFGLWAF